jgi:AraC-like DNA-binding protein
MNIKREVAPLTKNDCFAIFSREKNSFDSPLHNHEYFEINLLLNATGARRIVGNNIGEVGNVELVCIGPNLAHGWFKHNNGGDNIKEVTIQFQKDLFDEKFLKKNQLVNIRDMFEKAKRGILFAPVTVETLAPRITALDKKKGFESVMELLMIINQLSIAPNSQVLSDPTFVDDEYNYISRRIENVFEFMNENFSRNITLSDAANVANMAVASFSRFLKYKTGGSFVEKLNEIRLGHVSRMLIDTTHSISEIAYLCGFNNMANFNRTFKNVRGITPNEFRATFIAHKVFV